MSTNAESDLPFTAVELPTTLFLLFYFNRSTDLRNLSSKLASTLFCSRYGSCYIFKLVLTIVFAPTNAIL
jgi:hypothetical protein